jgi:hypothetical protein
MTDQDLQRLERDYEYTRRAIRRYRRLSDEACRNARKCAGLLELARQAARRARVLGRELRAARRVQGASEAAQ